MPHHFERSLVVLDNVVSVCVEAETWKIDQMGT